MTDADATTRKLGTGLSLRVDGPVHWLTLDRPASLNAIDQEMIAGLDVYFTERLHDSETRIIVMRGAGGHFCSGADINGFSGDFTTTIGGDWALRDVIRNMRACPQPIIAALDGAVAGGGMAFALAADVRIAATSMKMNAAFISVGLSGAELGVSWHLPRAVGSSIANELMMTGRPIGAERALATGLVSEVWAEDELGAAAERMARDMLRANPEGLRLTKRTVDAARSVGSLEAAMELEERAQLRCFASTEFRTAVETFLKRKKK